MATEDTDKTPATEATADEQDTAPVAQSEELSKAELEEVSGGVVGHDGGGGRT